MTKAPRVFEKKEPENNLFDSIFQIAQQVVVKEDDYSGASDEEWDKAPLQVVYVTQYAPFNGQQLIKADTIIEQEPTTLQEETPVNSAIESGMQAEDEDVQISADQINNDQKANIPVEAGNTKKKAAFFENLSKG